MAADIFAGISHIQLSFIQNLSLTHYRPAMQFANRKNVRESFQSNLVTV